MPGCIHTPPAPPNALTARRRHANCGARCLPGTGIVDDRVSVRIDHVPLRILPRRHAASKRI